MRMLPAEASLRGELDCQRRQEEQLQREEAPMRCYSRLYYTITILILILILILY